MLRQIASFFAEIFFVTSAHTNIRTRLAKSLRKVGCAQRYIRTYFDLLVGDALSSVAISFFAFAGAGATASNTISFASSFLPYKFLFASLSGRSVEPSSETPANSPRAREYDKMSARKVTSVSADAVRPTGPAAAEASPPSSTLLVRMLPAERSFIKAEQSPSPGLRAAIRRVQNLAHCSSGILNPFLLLFLGSRRQRQHRNQSRLNSNFFMIPPKLSRLYFSEFNRPLVYFCS
jgi:hypothetical protein